MWQSITRIVMLVLALAIWDAGIAQPKTNSPMSSIGLGDLNEPDFVAASSMGGIGAVYHHPYVTNIVNPAALGYLKATSFEIAVGGRWTRMEKEGFKEEFWSGNLEYMSLSVPLINPINDILERREGVWSAGLNISLSPYSQVGYLVNSFGNIDSIGNVESTFRGKGGLNRLNVGTGWKYKQLSFGINLGYLFGAMEYQTTTELVDRVNAYNHIALNEYSFRGFLYDLGVMYELPLKKQSKRQNLRTVTFGAHFNSSTSFTGKEDYLNMVTSELYAQQDTAEYLDDAKVSGTMPGQVGIGVMLTEANLYSVGLTYTYTTWSQYKNSARPDVLEDAWKLSAGVSFTPEYNSITSYFSRVEYRAGAFYAKDPRSLSGSQVTEYGFSIGFGFPFIQQRFFTFLDLSLDYGWRGVQNGLKENYLNFKVGFNLNDTQWFIKRRFN